MQMLGSANSALPTIRKQMERTMVFFRFVLDSAIELDATGQPCCDKRNGNTCPYNTGCNNHVIYYFPPTFNFTLGQTTCVFSGTASAASGSQSCVPPGDAQFICSNFNIDYSLSDSDQDYPVGNDTLKVFKDGLIGSVKISPWAWAPGATGLRLRFLLMVRGASANTFNVQPSGIQADSPVIFSKPDTTGVTVKDKENRDAGATFSFITILDGANVPVNISGPYAHELLTSAKYFYVDMPKFSSTMQFTYTAFIPSVSAPGLNTGPTKGNSAGSALTIIIVCSVVFGVCCICVTIAAIIIKLR